MSCNLHINITFKIIFEYILKKLVLCIQIRFVSTEKTTRIASRASCSFCNDYKWHARATKYTTNLYKFIVLEASCKLPSSG